MLFDWQPGQEITIHYPTITDVHLIDKCKWRPRRVAVRSCRDLLRHPLTAEEFARRPYVARSRWLLRIVDLDAGEYRQIYLGTTQEYRSPQVLRFGAFDRVTNRLLRLLDREFQPTVTDRRLMLRSINRWTDTLHETEHLGIFSADLQLSNKKTS